MYDSLFVSCFEMSCLCHFFLLASINDFSLEGFNLITIFVRQSNTML